MKTQFSKSISVHIIRVNNFKLGFFPLRVYSFYRNGHIGKMMYRCIYTTNLVSYWILVTIGEDNGFGHSTFCNVSRSVHTVTHVRVLFIVTRLRRPILRSDTSLLIDPKHNKGPICVYAIKIPLFLHVYVSCTHLYARPGVSDVSLKYCHRTSDPKNPKPSHSTY